VKKEQQPKTKKLFITMPFVNDNQVREIRRSLRKCNLDELISVSFTSKTLSSLLRPVNNLVCKTNCEYCKSNSQDKTCKIKNIVYRIECGLCNDIYIGETSRTMQSRIKEHCKMHSSQVFNHFVTHHPNVTPGPDVITWSVLHAGLRHTQIRRSVEECEIRSKAPGMNLKHT
jgi:hypothetical protein